MTTFPVIFNTEAANNAQEVRLSGQFSTNDGWSIFPTTQSGETYYLSSAQQVYLVSDSAGDDTGGTGAIKVLVTGLDSSSNMLTETITLNGTTYVTSSNSFRRIFSVKVVETGTLLANQGKIEVAQDTGFTNILSTVEVGLNTSNYMLYTVPNGYKLLVESIKTEVYGALANPTASTEHTLVLNRRTVGGTETAALSLTSMNGKIDSSDEPLVTFYEKEDVKVFYQMENTATLTIIMSGLLIDKDL